MRRASTYLGKPCERGHRGVRYKSAGTCVECRREQSAAYNALPEVKAARAAARATPKVKQQKAAYYAKHRERPEFKARRAKYIAEYSTSPEGRAAQLLSGATARARKKGLPVSITREWITKRLLVGVCEISGLRFDFTAANGGGPYSPSLDRIDSTGGYTTGNTRVICWALNAAFAGWGDQVLRPIVEAWLRATPRP